MGLSRKKTNLAILRSKLQNLTVGSGIEQESKQEEKPMPVVQGKLIKEAKKAGRKKNELIDGSRLLTCG